MDRATLATLVHRRLSSLASDAGLTTQASDGQSEGSYTDAIDAALRTLGAYEATTGLLDSSLLTVAQHNQAISLVTQSMLQLLQFHYSTLVDIKVGAREEKLSQIRQALAGLAGSGAGSAARQVMLRPLARQADDYEL